MISWNASRLLTSTTGIWGKVGDLVWSVADTSNTYIPNSDHHVGAPIEDIGDTIPTMAGGARLSGKLYCENY